MDKCTPLFANKPTNRVSCYYTEAYVPDAERVFFFHMVMKSTSVFHGMSRDMGLTVI